MIEEDKNLLIQDLCARLPYGVKIKTSYDKIDEPMELIFINPRNESFAIGGSFTLISGLDFDIYKCKPYLFPLSSMTEEQKKEEYEICKYYLNGYETKLIDFYHKNHLDHRGLIPMGLAIDATGLGIYL